MEITAPTEAVSSPPEEKWHWSQQWRQTTSCAGQKPGADWESGLQIRGAGRESRKPLTPVVGMKPYGKSRLRRPKLDRALNIKDSLSSTVAHVNVDRSMVVAVEKEPIPVFLEHRRHDPRLLSQTRMTNSFAEPSWLTGSAHSKPDTGWNRDSSFELGAGQPLHSMRWLATIALVPVR